MEGGENVAASLFGESKSAEFRMENPLLALPLYFVVSKKKLF